MTLSTPVAFLIFKRPDTTEKVFEAIRQAKPKKLLVVADGARPDKPGELEKCAAARAIINRVDWDCEVLKNYSEVNLGCGIRPETGISWVFEQVEEAIILEDDCLPDPSFFRFCEELLEMYRYDERIMMIGGANVLGEYKSNLQSYHFSLFSGIWGWASWRRAWKFYDYEMGLWKEASDIQFLKSLFSISEHRLFWENLLQEAFEDNNRSYWDYQWLFARWVQNGLGIVPEVNLISNIGFGADATHTSGDSPLANMPGAEIQFPLKHPPFLIRNLEMDNLIQGYFSPMESMSFKKRVVRKIQSIVREAALK